MNIFGHAQGAGWESEIDERVPRQTNIRRGNEVITIRTTPGGVQNAYYRYTEEQELTTSELLTVLNQPPRDKAKPTLAVRDHGPITVHDDLILPEGTRLGRHTRVRFGGASDYIEARMPTTRDIGWIEISTGRLSTAPTVQLRNGLLMLRAENKD